jgi:multidrug efflux system outer membrane protein
VRIRQARAALLVLAGEPVSGLPPLAMAAAPALDAAVRLPSLQGPLPVARPLDLLRLRPDLRAAEQALLAAAADVGVARAALYPSLRLPGTLVLATGAGLLDRVTSAIALVLDAQLYDGGARRAEVDAARSRLREATLVYRQTLLQALQQIDAALVGSAGAQRRIAALQRAVEASQAALDQAITLYEAGLSAQLDVLDARRLALEQQRDLTRAEADAARQAVALFEATGLIEPASRPAAGNAARGLPRPG